MNVNETGTNLDTIEQLIDEFPDDAHPAMMEDYINKELDDMNQNHLNEKNKIGLDEEEGEKTAETINEDVIHRNMNKNGTETNRDTLEEIIYECSDDTPPVVMEGYVNEDLDDGNQNDFIE